MSAPSTGEMLSRLGLGLVLLGVYGYVIYRLVRWLRRP